MSVDIVYLGQNSSDVFCVFGYFVYFEEQNMEWMFFSFVSLSILGNYIWFF